MSIVMCLPLMAQADDKKYEVNGIWYTVDLVTFTAEVTSGDEKYSGEVSIPYQVNVVDGDLNGVFNVRRIGEKAFKDCKGMTGVGIPQGLEAIGREAFKNCASLKTINLFESEVRSIGESTFENCTALETVSFNEHTFDIGEKAFKDCRKLRYVSIPYSIQQLGAGAFYGCDGLETVELLTDDGTETHLDRIGEEAFAYCPKAAIGIPEGIREIGAGAFRGNGKAVWYLPHSLESIESNAFQDCPVTSVHCYATKPPMVSKDAFDNPQKAVLCVPYADRYKSADTWKDLGTIENSPIPEELRYRPYPPTIEYADGQLHFSSMDDDVEFNSFIECEDAGRHYNEESVSLSALYHIRAEAYIEGRPSSDQIHAYLCWIDREQEKEPISTSVAEVKVKGTPILVERRNDVITIKGAAVGTSVRIYNLSGEELVSRKITDTVTSFVTPWKNLIVKVGEYAIKIL